MKKHAVCGDRDHQYGSPEDNFDQIARFWSIYLHTNLSSCDVANMMILFKLARNMTGEPKKENVERRREEQTMRREARIAYLDGDTDALMAGRESL